MAMALLISIVAFAGLMLIIAYFGYRFYVRPGRVYEQLGGPATSSMPVVSGNFGQTPGDAGLVVTIVEQLGRAVPIDPEDASMVRRDLMAAGYRQEGAVTIYSGIRVLSTIVLILLALAFRGLITSNTVLGIVIPVAAGFAGWFGPSFFLDHLVSARMERIRFGLPDALDLTVVCVEAGLGLDQALQHVSKELHEAHPDICDELEIVNLEIRAGKRRAEALRNLADRNDEPEIRKLVAVMIQTDRFGTSIADSLRTHGDFMRTRRRQEAEERAAKIGVKLVFPIFFLILPAMLVVVAGPGLLQVFKYLFPIMRQFQMGI
jgi:tight adherence protein C